MGLVENPDHHGKTRSRLNPGKILDQIAARWQIMQQSKMVARLFSWYPVRVFRSSLTVRITSLMAVSVVVMMGILSVFVVSHVRDGLFDKRLNQVLSDSSIRFQSIQKTFDESEASSEHEVQELTFTYLRREREAAAGAGAVGIMLLPNPKEQKNAAINAVLDDSLELSLSDNLRQAVRSQKGSYWQSVGLLKTLGNRNAAEGTENEIPGIVVGTTVQLPVVGSYELYLVYSLEHEAETITMIVQILTLGTILLLVILIVMMAAVSHSTLRPVRRTAAAAQRFSEGQLDVRVPTPGIDELSQLGRSFNNMAETLENQIANYEQLALLQQRFVSDVSHELRTPLASIRIAADLLYDAQELLPASFHRTSEILHKEVDRFDSMLADLIEISRIDAANVQLNLGKVRLLDLVNTVVDANQALAQKLGVEIRINSFIADDSQVEIDQTRVQRIIRNLLTNAIEYAEGNPVQVNLAETESCLAIQVVDHGLGMVDQVSQHVFDRFYRADPSRKRTTGGTGLGLAISAEDAALHGGMLTVLSCPQWGSAFLLLLPRNNGQEIVDIPEQVEIEELNLARAHWAKEHPEDIILPDELEGYSLQVKEISETLPVKPEAGEADA